MNLGFPNRGIPVIESFLKSIDKSKVRPSKVTSQPKKAKPLPLTLGLVSKLPRAETSTVVDIPLLLFELLELMELLVEP